MAEGGAFLGGAGASAGEGLVLVLSSGGGSGGSGITGASNIGAGDGLVSGVLNDDIKVKSLIGGSNISLSAS